MLRVEEILTLDPLTEFRLIAGGKGLHREVTNVTILDYETDSKDFSSFKWGDFILTSLFFAKDDESLVKEAFSHLLERGIAGMAIKSIYYPKVPQALIKSADAARVPVFLYETAYMEDIIIAVNEYMRFKKQNAYAEEKINSLLERERTPHFVEKTARQIDPLLKMHIVAGYATPIGGERFEENALLPRLIQKHTPLREGCHSAFFKYKNGILLLLSSDCPLAKADATQLLLKSFSGIGLHAGNCLIGTGNMAHAYEGFDATVLQSIRANHICRLGETPHAAYDDLGIQRLLFGLRSDTVAAACGKSLVDTLALYDRKTQGALLPTLVAYVKNRGDINQTAAALFQHANTVRYRIKKAKELLNIEEDFYEYMFLAVSLYLLDKDDALDEGKV